VVEAGAKLLIALTALVKKQNNVTSGMATDADTNQPSTQSRLLLLLLIGVAVIALPIYVNIYLNHTYFDSKVLLIVLMCGIYGVAGLYDPRIAFTGAGFLEGRTKWISLSLIVVLIVSWLGLTKVLNDSYAVTHPSSGITVENDEGFNALATKLAPQIEAWRASATNQPQSVSPSDIGLAEAGITQIVYGRCNVDGFYVVLMRGKADLQQSTVSTPNAYNFSTDSDHFNNYGEGCAPKGWLVLRKVKLGNGWWKSVAIE
jgi:hypothetical protein